MGGGGGGKGGTPEVKTTAVSPAAPAVAPVNPEAKEATVQDVSIKDKQAALQKTKSVYFDEDRLGETATSAGSVYSKTLGG